MELSTAAVSKLFHIKDLSIDIFKKIFLKPQGNV